MSSFLYRSEYLTYVFFLLSEELLWTFIVRQYYWQQFPSISVWENIYSSLIVFETYEFRIYLYFPSKLYCNFFIIIYHPYIPLLPLSPTCCLCPWVRFPFCLISRHPILPIAVILLPMIYLYFACEFNLFIRIHIWVRSYGICLSLNGLFHLA